MPKKLKYLYVTRMNVPIGESFYSLHKKLGAKREREEAITNGNRLPGEFDIFCPREWEEVTGFKLKPGETKKIKINVEEIK